MCVYFYYTSTVASSLVSEFHAGDVKFVFSFVLKEAKCSDYKSRLQYRFCSPILNVIECRVVTNEKKKR